MGEWETSTYVHMSLISLISVCQASKKSFEGFMLAVQKVPNPTRHAFFTNKKIFPGGILREIL